MPEPSSGALDLHGPTAVGLTRLSKRLSFPPGGEALYRSILRLVKLGDDDEFVVVPCSRGVSALFITRATDASGSGVDADATLVDVANERAKRAGMGDKLQFERASLEDLPYQDAVFDLALGEVELADAADPQAAIRELARVTRPGGAVVLVQLVWTRSPEPEREAELVRRLGVRPRMPVEWKQMLGDAGITDLVVEDWSDNAAPDGQPSVLGGLAELFTVPGRIRILHRAWRRWRWRGLGAVLAPDRELRELVMEERALGVTLIKGVRVANATEKEDAS